MVTKQISGPSRQRAQLLLREICHFLPRSLSFLRNSSFSASAVHLSFFVFIIYLSICLSSFFLYFSFSICSPATNFRGNGNQNVDFHVYNFLLHLLTKPFCLFYLLLLLFSFLCLLCSFLFCLSTTRNIQMRRKCFFLVSLHKVYIFFRVPFLLFQIYSRITHKSTQVYEINLTKTLYSPRMCMGICMHACLYEHINMFTNIPYNMCLCVLMCAGAVDTKINRL